MWILTRRSNVVGSFARVVVDFFIGVLRFGIFTVTWFGFFGELCFKSMEVIAPFVKIFCFDVLDPMKEKENEVISRDFAFSLSKRKLIKTHIGSLWNACNNQTNINWNPYSEANKGACIGQPLYIHACMHTYIHTIYMYVWSFSGATFSFVFMREYC